MLEAESEKGVRVNFAFIVHCLSPDRSERNFTLTPFSGVIARMTRKSHLHASDLHGVGRLAVDATLGLTRVVETMHHNLLRVPGVFGKATHEPVSGLTGMVYRSIRGVTRLVGGGVDTVLAQLLPAIYPDARPAQEPVHPSTDFPNNPTSSTEREAVLAALNGVLGDHLAASGNPLAIPMRLRRDGVPLELGKRALAEAIPNPTGKILLLAHGLCMNDLQWRRKGHDVAVDQLRNHQRPAPGKSIPVLRIGRLRHSISGQRIIPRVERGIPQRIIRAQAPLVPAPVNPVPKLGIAVCSPWSALALPAATAAPASTATPAKFTAPGAAETTTGAARPAAASATGTTLRTTGTAKAPLHTLRPEAPAILRHHRFPHARIHPAKIRLRLLNALAQRSIYQKRLVRPRSIRTAAARRRSNPRPVARRCRVPHAGQIQSLEARRRVVIPVSSRLLTATLLTRTPSRRGLCPTRSGTRSRTPLKSTRTSPTRNRRNTRIRGTRLRRFRRFNRQSSGCGSLGHRIKSHTLQCIRLPFHRHIEIERRRRSPRGLLDRRKSIHRHRKFARLCRHSA